MNQWNDDTECMGCDIHPKREPNSWTIATGSTSYTGFIYNPYIPPVVTGIGGGIGEPGFFRNFRYGPDDPAIGDMLARAGRGNLRPDTESDAYRLARELEKLPL